MYGNRSSAAEQRYEKGYACYLKYGKDTLEGKTPDPRDLDDAVSHLEMALIVDPLLAKAMVMLGLIHSVRGNDARALTYYEDALVYKSQLGNQAAEVERLACDLRKKIRGY